MSTAIAPPKPIVLPADLDPVARAGEDLPARTWAVVTRPDDGEPQVERAGLSSVAARKLAELLAGAYGAGVYVLYRTPDAVTVHTAHVGEPRSCLGTLAVDKHADPDSEWRKILRTHGVRDPRIAAARRLAHGMMWPPIPIGAPLLVAGYRRSVPDSVYLTAYVLVIGNPIALHKHATREHRAERMHRTAPDQS